MSGSHAPPAHPEEHTQLFSALAERLLDGEGDDQPARRAHLLRLLSRLMPEASIDSRHALVKKLSDMIDPPSDLALVMARDTPDISAPLLKYVPFSHDELVGLIARTGPEHHTEIARRADLTLDVWLSMARAAARRAGHRSVGENAEHRQTPAKEEQPAGRKFEEPPSPEPEPVTQSRETPATGSVYTETETRPSAQREAPVQADAPDSPADSNTPHRHREPGDTPVRSRLTNGDTSLRLDDTDSASWHFETDSDGRIVRLSSNAALAFGDLAPSLAGQYLAVALQDFAASPAADDIGEAMKRRAPIRNIRVELQPPGAAPRRWSILASPRFTFPDGRFEGYSGDARDPDILEQSTGKTAPPKTAVDLLNRLSSAAERLAEAADTPELRDYAVTMRDYARSLQMMAQEDDHGQLFPFPNNTSS